MVVNPEHIPHYEQVVVPQSKITDYLLSSTHPDGKSKAEFFTRFGFSSEKPQIFAEALRQHAAENEVAKVETTPFGTKYSVEGPLVVPDGRTPSIRSIWFVDTGEALPRLVTAYPYE